MQKKRSKIVIFKTVNVWYSYVVLEKQFSRRPEKKKTLNLITNKHALQAMIHVSTAYSNADKQTIQESVYKPPGDPSFVINCCQKMSEDQLGDLSRRLQGNHPNTYTMTKAMAEWVVAEQADDIPAAIVRPSIGKAHRTIG